MWIFTIAPDWVIHAITGAGIIGIITSTILGFIPFINRYKLPIQVLSLIVLVIGIFLEGGLSNQKQWKAKVKEMELRVVKAELKAQNKNIEIQENVVTKTQIIREKGKTITEYIDKLVTKEIIKEVPIEGPERERIVEVIKYIENCPVPQELINIHNSAARLEKTGKDLEILK